MSCRIESVNIAARAESTAILAVTVEIYRNPEELPIYVTVYVPIDVYDKIKPYLEKGVEP